MSDQKQAVSYSESIKIMGERVGKMIQQEIEHSSTELILCGNTGGHPPFGPQETDNYSFMVENHRKEGFFRHFLWSWGFGRPEPRKIVAYLWFSNDARKATRKRWVLELFSREYDPFLRSLAQLLAEKFDVEIHIRLQSENPRWEGVGYYD